MLSRRSLLAGLLAGPQARHNLLLITADNLGYGDLGCYGNTEIKTPHFDAFSRQGLRFTNFYTACPTCTASRAGLLTGRYPLRYGLNRQLRAEETAGIGLPHSEKLIPQYLKPHGYSTGCFGKWNIGFAPGSRPTDRGFDEFFGHRSGNIDYYSHLYNGELDMYRGAQPAPVQGYSVDLFADAANNFIRRQRANPFFLYLPFNSPHYPNKANLRPGEPLEWQAPDKYFAEYGYSPKEPDPRKRYRAVVTALDDAFGRVIRHLDRTGLAKRTLVFFYSDNGAFMLPNRGLEVQTNRPLRDGGVTCFEGGIRVAGMARWPGEIPQHATCDEVLSAFDLLPLALRLAGASIPKNPQLDGIDPLGALRAKTKMPPRDLFFEYQKHQGMRSANWKIVRTAPQSPWQLYDLARDIGESNDLAATNPSRVNELASRYETWRKEIES
ncbi:MAG: sulfatase-like hydrolase/transferase [Bryobacterales bacterium]|nr:sulfatase-like hydrolase/transferase [Bryobacterales bacterium]